MDQDPEALQQKLTMVEAAVQLYEQNEEPVTFHQIAAASEVTVSEIFNYFDDKHDIFCFYYCSLITRYRLMIDEIEGFEAYTLSEKLSNFVFTSFDMMQEHEAFVNGTFTSYILCSAGCKRYRAQLQHLLHDFIEYDDLVSASGKYVAGNYALKLIAQKYLLLVKFWLKDDTDDKEATMEFTDKLTGLFQEIMYTSVIDRGVDLVKFLYTNSSFSCDSPLYDKMCSTFDIR